MIDTDLLGEFLSPYQFGIITAVHNKYTEPENIARQYSLRHHLQAYRYLVIEPLDIKYPFFIVVDVLNVGTLSHNLPKLASDFEQEYVLLGSKKRGISTLDAGGNIVDSHEAGYLNSVNVITTLKDIIYLIHYAKLKYHPVHRYPTELRGPVNIASIHWSKFVKV